MLLLHCHTWKFLLWTTRCLHQQHHCPENTCLLLEQVCQKGSMSSSKASAACCWLERQKCKQPWQRKVLLCNKTKSLDAFICHLCFEKHCGVQKAYNSCFCHMEAEHTGFTTFCNNVVFCQPKLEKMKEAKSNKRVSNSSLQKHDSFFCKKFQIFQVMGHSVANPASKPTVANPTKSNSVAGPWQMNAIGCFYQKKCLLCKMSDSSTSATKTHMDFYWKEKLPIWG